jgi:uncharacterized damage-inducible protein DinB
MSKLSTDPVQILIASDAWGTKVILDICATLTREQFHHKFEIGLGSLHDTLTHMISTMRRWTDRLANRPVRPMLHVVPEFLHVLTEPAARTPEQLLKLLEEALADLTQVAQRTVDEHRLGSLITLDWPDGDVIKTYTFTRAAVLAHVTSHGYHHRAQCLNMLRQLGAPVPGVTPSHLELSAVDWQSEFESPPKTRPARS